MTKQQDTVLFFAGYGSATVQFYMSLDDIKRFITSDFIGELVKLRADLREVIRTGFIDGKHTSKLEHDHFNECVTAFFVSHPKFEEAINNGMNGFAAVITNKCQPKEFNFRVMMGSVEGIERFASDYRAEHKTDVFTREQIEKKKAEKPVHFIDEKLPLPRPDICLAALERFKSMLPYNDWKLIERILRTAEVYVFQPGMLGGGYASDVIESAKAMCQYNLFSLPFEEIYLETKVQIGDRRDRVGVCITQNGADLRFFQFIWLDKDRVGLLPIDCSIIHEELVDGRKLLSVKWLDEGVYQCESDARDICNAISDAIIEMLVLTNTKGVIREKVERKSQGKRRERDSVRDRNYNVVRVPLVKSEQTGGHNHGNGRTVRPHIRAAHIWGKNTRPIEQQQYRQACLVNAEDGSELPERKTRIIK